MPLYFMMLFLLLVASGGVSSTGGCFDGVRPSYVLAGAVGWTNTASHVVHMSGMRNLRRERHIGCQQVRGERAL